MGCHPSTFTEPVPLFLRDAQRGGVACSGHTAAARTQLSIQQAPRPEKPRSGLNGALHSRWARRPRREQEQTGGNRSRPSMNGNRPGGNRKSRLLVDLETN